MRPPSPLLFLILTVSCNQTPVTENDKPTDRNQPSGSEDSTRDATPNHTPNSNSSDQPRPQQRDEHVVMVIDTGFVTDHPVFANKIVASYTMSCPDFKLLNRDFPTYEARKQDWLQNLNRYTQSCTVKEGLPPIASASFNGIAQYREQWNQAVRNKTLSNRFPNFNQINRILGGQDINRTYHGTSTAGIIAYQNPSIKLVLIENDSIDSDGDPTDDLNCPNTNRIQQFVQLANDPQVFDTELNAGLDSYTRLLLEIAQRHNVTLANLSFGPPSRQGLRELYQRIGCQNIPSLSQLYVAENEKAQRMYQSRQQNGQIRYDYLGVVAAGNDGDQVDSFADTFTCQDIPANFIAIGALNANGQLANFSNRGRCVSMYTLGENVVVAKPQGFLSVESGTSFSAPLAVRHFSLNLSPSLPPQQMTQAALQQAQSSTLTPATYPNELAYMLPARINNYALTVLQAPNEPPTNRVVGLPWLKPILD